MTVKISDFLTKGPVGEGRWIAAEKAMYPIIIDVEASGFGRGSYPIEVGVALGDGSRHCYLVSPVRGWRHWDQAAERVHGISRAVLESYGRPARDVARRLNALLRRKVV